MTDQKTELPKGWVQATVDDIAQSIQYGYTASATTKHTGTRMLRITDIQGGQVSWENVPFCKISKDDEPLFLLKSGDLVFARTGATVGKSYLLREPIPKSIYASYLIRVKTHPSILDRYIYAFFHTSDYWTQIKQGQLGIGQPNVNSTILARLTLPLAPLPEQHRIVAKIEELFSDLDAGVEALKKVKAQIKRYRQSVLKAAFEGKLTAKWRKANRGKLEPASVLLERIQDERKKAYGKKFKDLPPVDTSELPELPEGWNWVRCCEISAFITKGTTPHKNKLYALRGEVPFIKVYNLTRAGLLDFSISPTFVDRSTHNGSLNRSIVFSGDVLMNIVGPPLGKISIVPDTFPEWNINQAIARYRTCEYVINKYLAFFLMSSGATRLLMSRSKATAGQFNLTLSTCRDLELPLCCTKEQRQIVAEIERRFVLAERIEEIVEQSLKQSQRLRQSILKRAFSGLLVPQDPKDEPAEKLMERINAIRESSSKPFKRNTYKSRKTHEG